jgi:hypothetical protein
MWKVIGRKGRLLGMVALAMELYKAYAYCFLF